MKGDLIIGVVVSLVLHVGAVAVGEWLNNQAPVTQVQEEDTNLIQFIAPPLPVEEPEIIESTEATTQPVEMAPPMQQDMPQMVQPDSFVQPIQPPPPEALERSTGPITIPTGDLYRRFGEIFDVSKLDTIPQATVQQAPAYPVAMRKQGIRGEVVVRFIVDSNGVVQQARVMRSSQREFEEPALNAVNKWRFRPGRKGGRPVATWMEQQINFNVE